MKRFYKLVSTKDVPGGFCICLDGKEVKTPSGEQLVASRQSLADEIVKEWSGQEENIVPDTMPLTQILTTKIDRVLKKRAPMTIALMKYLDTDLLCYRTKEPSELAKLQQEIWDPWLDWFESRFGGVLQTTTGLTALRQGKAVYKAVQDCIKAKTDDEFAILQLVVSLSGSLVLGLAFVEKAATPDQVFAAAYVEENYKADIYNEAEHGGDPAQEKKQEAMKKDLEAAAKYLELV